MPTPLAAPTTELWRRLLAVLGLVLSLGLPAAAPTAATVKAAGDGGGVTATAIRLAPGAFAIPADRAPVQITARKDGWTTLFADDFEGSFPGPWQLLNQGVDAGWGRWTCWSGDSPTHGVGSAAGGSLAIGCDQDYRNNQSSWLAVGPFALDDPAFTAAELRFNFRLQSEEGFDFFRVLASVNGDNFFGFQFSGTIAPQSFTFDLTNVPTLGNLLGQDEVWIAFLFTSDGSVVAPNGAQVDDVVLRVAVPAANQPPQVAVVSPNGGEVWSAGSQRTITYTASDPDGGPDPLAIAVDYSIDGGSTWQPIAAGLANTGSFGWTVADVATTEARVRVRASDGADESQDVSDANFTITQPIPGDNVVSVADGSGPAGGSAAISLLLANEQAVQGLQVDLLYDPAVVAFSGLAATGRGEGLTAAANQVASGRSRVVLYHAGAGAVAAGSGAVASLVFDLVGPAGAQSTVSPVAIILSDPDGLELAATGAAGKLQIAAAAGVPVLQIAALKNPGRPRTLQIFVVVTDGSGSPPTVTAGGTAVSMTPLGGGRFRGAFAAAAGTTSVLLAASDTNGNGPGATQAVVSFE